MLFALMVGGKGKDQRTKGDACYIVGTGQGTPPPIAGATNSLYPHNFSHQKYRKKSPWSDWKKFRKKFVGKCFGEKESPQSCGKGARGC